MFDILNFAYLVVLQSIVCQSQINLYSTDASSENEDLIQDYSLRFVSMNPTDTIRQLISYCMNSSSTSKYNITNNDTFPKFTFDQLQKKNITSQELYHWSAPIDLVENYQVYLNQLSDPSDSSFGKKIFYNCTLPRFGSLCQYEFNYYNSDKLFLYEMITDFYQSGWYEPTKLTCYIHLECNRGPLPSCLDWSEICDGKVDCYNDMIDEKYCWQLEINECQDDEFRCNNGQCIPKSFYLDDEKNPDCLDQSDEYRSGFLAREECLGHQPSFRCDDVICSDTFFTSSCMDQRTKLLIKAFYSFDSKSISDDCWLTFMCLPRMPNSIDPICYDHYRYKKPIDIIERKCSDMILMPIVPVLFTDIYLAYNKNDSYRIINQLFVYPFVCYNNSRYDSYFINIPKILFNNLTCYRFNKSNPEHALSSSAWYESYMLDLYKALKKYTLTTDYNPNICNRTNMYQCINSLKCVSVSRLMDSVNDCPYNDDEDMNRITNTVFIERIKQTYYKCQLSDKYIPQSLISNGNCDCGHFPEDDRCEDEYSTVDYIKTTISFQTICDDFTELSPQLIDGENHTDETECQQWLCDNIYTRCDGLWNCPNGADETGCSTSTLINCSSNEHICISPNTNQPICLPVTKANDNNADCLGGFDEPHLCNNKNLFYRSIDFYCKNGSSDLCISTYEMCNGQNNCLNGDDEQFCKKNRTDVTFEYICYGLNRSQRSDTEEFLCKTMSAITKDQIIPFSLNGLRDFRFESVIIKENAIPTSLASNYRPKKRKLYCHRGFDVDIWLNDQKNLTRKLCFCPPSYYGNKCQYQNERVSLSIQFRASASSWQIPFLIIISLIDNTTEHIIHSYEQLNYLSRRDCKKKFNLYLTYSTKPKDQTKQYFIHIDIYEKLSLNYRGSLLIPIQHLFLPVHRLTLLVHIPYDDIQYCLINHCLHGKCIKYSNNLQNETFCQCDRGWFGRYCNMSYNCTCSHDSICLGITTNHRSVCLCPNNRYGPRCYLNDISCWNNPCQNNGQCISADENIQSNETFTCICSKSFRGKRCEIIENKLMITFEQNVMISQSIFLHFIEIIENIPPRRSSTLRTIPFKQNSILIHWSQPYHLVFAEFSNKSYYLVLMQYQYNQSIMINKTISSLDRCQHINELFNKTIVNLHLLRRIKYYQLPCQTISPKLACFYDNTHLCICQNNSNGKHRVANCFEFDHNMTFNCYGQSVCEHGGQCFQDTSDCPQRSICVCPPCFYGTRCQFSTNRLGLSFDAILGYHIQPNISLIHQPSIVQISIGLNIIFIILGLINSILGIITFQNKNVLNVGCGYYLLVCSITSLLTMIIFGLKFWILLFAQMSFHMNKTFLSIQCYAIDFILRICLNMDQWLNACVAIERAVTIIKGTQFNTRISKKLAKIIIILLLIFMIGTNIHDIIYRNLIEEENEDEKRIWCTVTYPSRLQTYNSFINSFYFLTPFILNIISAIILIKKLSIKEAIVNRNRNYKQILREQIREHKHLLIAPIVLVILTLPRLIISFISKCMKSSNDSWLYLTAYFISFIPPLLTFILFILPSKFYMTECRQSLVRYRTNIRNRLHL